MSFSKGIIAQKIILSLSSKDSLENITINRIDYQKSHTSLKSVHKEINSFSKKLKLVGYFNNSIKSSILKDSIHTTIFDLGTKTKKVIIKIPDSHTNSLQLKTNKGRIELKIENLSVFLNSISNKLEKNGESFSKAFLKNIILKENILYAELSITQTLKRKIDRVIIKGYDNFPKSYISKFLNIKPNTIFNQRKLKDISQGLKSLSFIDEIKPPEILFSKDSTLIYLYLKKKNNNFFDGLISFNSKENGNGLVFNGHLDLELNNILNTGEQFKLLWKANGEERQSLQISTKIPYIFNSSFTPSFRFNIYKQDSTFLNTKFSSKISYDINQKTSLRLTLNSESSESILNNNTNIQSFNNLFLGSELIYQKPSNSSFFKNKFYLKTSFSFGNRRFSNSKTNQFKTTIISSYLIQLINRSYIFLKSEAGYLNSNNYLTNELYRLGGINSIRGFLTESTFTPKYFYSNIEYRYLTSNRSYLYSITDIGFYKSQSLLNKNLTSIGIGYLFPIKNSYINISYILNKTDNSSFSFNNSIIGIKFKSFF